MNTKSYALNHKLDRLRGVAINKDRAYAVRRNVFDARFKGAGGFKRGGALDQCYRKFVREVAVPLLFGDSVGDVHDGGGGGDSDGDGGSDDGSDGSSRADDGDGSDGGSDGDGRDKRKHTKSAIPFGGSARLSKAGHASYDGIATTGTNNDTAAASSRGDIHSHTRLRSRSASLSSSRSPSRPGSSSRPRPRREVMFQVKPNFRVHVPGTGHLLVHKHTDADYHHQPNEVNFWVPLTASFGTNTAGRGARGKGRKLGIYG